MRTTRRLTFTVSLTTPLGVSVYEVRDYIASALESYKPKGRVLASDRIKRVVVRRQGKKHVRAEARAEPIGLTDLINRLLVIDKETRLRGGLTPDMEIKWPISVTPDFGATTYKVVHVTAKIGRVLLHYFTDE